MRAVIRESANEMSEGKGEEVRKNTEIKEMRKGLSNSGNTQECNGRLCKRQKIQSSASDKIDIIDFRRASFVKNIQGRVG